jgi:hypothetical protein
VYPYDAFAADFHDLFTRDPNACVYLGVARRLDELPDPSLAGLEADAAATRALLARLDTVARDALGFDQLLDLDLARLALSARLHKATYTFNGRTMRAQMPTAGEDISGGIFSMFINDPRPDGERLANITARVEQVPAYLEALLGRLDTPVARWVAMDVEKVEGLPDLLANLQRWAEAVAWPDAGRLATARERAEEALGRYADRLRAMPTTTRIHVGEDTARRIVALRGIALPVAALLAAGTSAAGTAGRTSCAGLSAPPDAAPGTVRPCLFLVCTSLLTTLGTARENASRGPLPRASTCTDGWPLNTSLIRQTISIPPRGPLISSKRTVPRSMRVPA